MFAIPALILLAALPGLAISYLIFRLDKYDREPLLPLLLCFSAGALITLPVVWLEQQAYTAPHTSEWLYTLWLAFIAVAFNEECAKFLILWLGVYPRRFFDEPVDGMVYAVLIAMGFATIENITYAGRFGAEAILLRAFTAVPAHLCFAIIQGYYAGLARFGAATGYRTLLKGLVFSALFHGVYDFLIFQEWSDWLFVLATFLMYLTLLYAVRLFRMQVEQSPFKK
jgi:protease PrsW